MITNAQEQQVTPANRHHREPDFDVGDHVVIIKQCKLTGRLSDKLSFLVT
jgi:hypothetical protein